MVVFFDIDGTIVDDATQIIPNSTVEAVAQLKRRGHIAVVNTGRPYGHIDPRVRQMPFSGWVCGCGMELFVNGKWIYRKAPTGEMCRYVVDAVRQCGMQVIYEAENGLYEDGAHSVCEDAACEIGRMREKGFSVGQISDLAEPSFVKFVTYDAPGCRRAEFIARMEPYFTHIIRGGTMIEFVLKGCSKAGGMEALLNYLGEDRSNTLALGDSTNDLPMFSVAEHTVAMGESDPKLAQQAEYITGKVMEDGIAAALRHFGLIE